MDSITGGDVYIGCAESYLIKYLAKAVKNLNAKYDNIHYHITSGGTEQVIEKLERGILDIAFIVEPPELSRYNYLDIPETDKWGVYMLRDCPLAEKECITVDDLLPYPVFCSEQSVRADMPRWAGEKADKLNFIANFNLANNSFVFVREGLGVALSFEKIIDVKETTDLTFRPLEPPLYNKMCVIWKKYQMFTPVAEMLLEEIKNVIQ